MSSASDKLVALDPQDEAQTDQFLLAARPASLDGRVIGLLANNKPHSEELLRMISEVMAEHYSIKGIVEYNKQGHQWPATPEALNELAAQCDVMIHATAE